MATPMFQGKATRTDFWEYSPMSGLVGDVVKEGQVAFSHTRLSIVVEIGLVVKAGIH